MKKRQDMPGTDNPILSAEMQRTELQARQIDLETQNEELLQARDLLEESRDRYIDFYDFSPVGYLTLSHKALITEINLTGAAMLGEERSQLRRRRFAEFLALEDNDFWNRHFMAARQHEGKLTCELGILRGNGSRMDVQIDSLRLARDGGEPVVRLALTDITERKRAEAALRASEAQRRLLEQQKIIQTSLDGFWVVRVKDARILEANEAFCNMVGYPRAELLTMTVYDLEAEESPAETEAHLNRVIGVGYDRFETRHRHKQGHLIDLEVSVSYSESGGGVNFVFVRNITERKFAEQYERFRSHILERLSGADSLPDILEEIVLGVEQLSPRVICSILLLEGNRLGHGIAPSLPDFYNAAIEGVEIGIGVGSCGTAATSGERVIVADIQSHPYWTPFKELAAKAGLGACWSQPILSSAGQVLGTFAIYHREVHTPTASDISIIEQAAHLASIAIERKQAEAMLMQREREFRTFAENMPDNIVRYNRQGVTVYVNPALERTLGDLAATMICTTPREYHPDGSYEDYAQLLDAVLASGEAGELEKILPEPDGKDRVHQIRMVPERGENGEVVGVLSIGRDITERKRMEVSLVSRERELRALAESSPGMMGSFYLRPDGSMCMPYVSSKIWGHFGLTPQDVAVDATPLLAKTHPDDAQMVQDSIAESARSLTTWHEEYRILHPSKGERWMESNTNPEPHPDGGVIWYGNVHDITERKVAEEALRASEERMRLFFERQLVGMAITSPEKGWIKVNDKICTMLGYSREELVRLSWAELTYPEDLATDTAQFDRMLGGEIDSYTLEKRFVRKDGGIVFAELAVGCVRKTDRSVDYVLAMLEDITERKRAELELRAHAHSLECMGRVNQAIQGTTDLDQMMQEVLDIVLSSFECDRAFLLYPCDPDVDEWQVPMERTRPEYPGALALGVTAIPMDSESAAIVRIARDASGPVMFGPGAEYPPPPVSSESFGFKSEMLMAVHPKLGKPWIFGIHQCAHAKVWTENEVDLFRKIGWRLSDALTSLLMYRDLRASEQQYRTLAENFPDILIRYDREGRRTYVNPAAERIFAISAKQTMGLTLQEANPAKLPETYQNVLKHTLATGKRSEFEIELPISPKVVAIGFVTIAAERDANGAICGAISIARDISKLKQAERQLRELTAHLQSVREEEKAHLARELHDDLGQILFLLKLKVSGYTHDCTANSGALCGQLQEVLMLADRAIDTARNIVSALRPPALDYGIAAALKWLVENFVSNMNIQCELRIEDEKIRLDESKSLALFRIVQEALNNVAKHAQADRVEIGLNKGATDYVLSVRDNGTGFDTSEKKKGSFGLVGMQERALMHGGTVSIESRVGGGTEIVVRIPVD